MRTIFLLTALSILGISVSAQSTHKLTAGKINEYGLIYSLPVTVLDITIEAEYTVKRPGEFFKYAKKYLDIDNPVTKTEECWVMKSVTVTPEGVADPDEQYLMQFKAGSTPFLIVNDENLPLAINTEDIPQPEIQAIPSAVTAGVTPLETDAARQVVNEEMLQSQSTAKRAELAAAQIYALRQSRTDIITGQADQMPPDGQAMKLILDNITAQEAALTAMFVGTEQHSTAVKTIRYTPGEPIKDEVIARLSVTDGIVDADDLSGDPIYLTIGVLSRGELPVNEKGLTKQFPKGGVAYRIPGKAEVAISHNDNKLLENSFDIAQYGVVFGIDPGIFSDKKAPCYMIFNPVTGAVKEMGPLR